MKSLPLRHYATARRTPSGLRLGRGKTAGGRRRSDEGYFVFSAEAHVVVLARRIPLWGSSAKTVQGAELTSAIERRGSRIRFLPDLLTKSGCAHFFRPWDEAKSVLLS